MANHKSAIKRHKQSLKKRDANRAKRSEVRSAIRNTIVAVRTGKIEDARTLCRRAESMLASAAKKGLVHRANASRRISRLYALVNKTAAAPAS